MIIAATTFVRLSIYALLDPKNTDWKLMMEGRKKKNKQTTS